MQQARSRLALLASVPVLALSVAQVCAADATFVSQASGSDANPCSSAAAPCATLSGAYGKTDPGGVIHVLPGEYPALEITKSVEIVADGGQTSITSSATGGANTLGRFFVNTGAADDVRIRGFTLRAGTSGFLGPIAGISFVGAGALYVENCTLVNSDGNYGILFVPTGASELYVSNSVVSDNAGSAGGGILIKPSGSGSARVVLDNVKVQDNTRGILINGTSTTGKNTVTVRNSVSSGATSFGLLAQDGGGGSTSVTIEGSTLSNNTGAGVRATGANVTIRMRNSTVSGNGTGILAQTGAKLISHGGNVVAGNTSNGAFTQTLPQQ